MAEQSLFYKVAVSLIPGIGGVLAKNLIAYVGSPEAVFSESFNALVKIPGIGQVNARKIKNKDVLTRAEKEIAFIEKHGINTYFFTDKSYPRRLKNCTDSPVLIYTKGRMNLNEERVVSIVGTRHATSYGKKICEELIEHFSIRNYKILIVSGLAYGIDVHAHKAALKYNLPTVGVVGHGLDRLYPSLHADIARKMIENGGLVSDFPGGSKIDPANFIRRNRIVAGLADATIVVESAVKGGALITADIAFSYNRDVFAFPGRTDEIYSKGCNQLIRRNAANLIEGIDDLEYFMNWETSAKEKPVQASLFTDLSPEEEKVVNLLTTENTLFIDQISSALKMPGSKVSTLLMNMEFKNIVAALPGKMYKIR